MLIRSLMTSIMCMFLLVACGPGPDSMTTDISTRQVMAAADCGLAEKQPGVTVLTTDSELERAMAPLMHIAGQALTAQMRLDFTRELLVLVRMGQQSTGGYSLAMIGDKARLQEGWLELPVHWREPGPGMIVTQALTSPCLFVALPRLQYEGIRVVDQHGKVRVQESL